MTDPNTAARRLHASIHETAGVPGWPHGTERYEGDHFALVLNCPLSGHELVRGLDTERCRGWCFLGQADVDGIGDCLVLRRM